jgi:outer membrane protein TolC
MAARNEVLAVQVEREQAELARLQAETAAAVVNADLARLVDVPAGTRLEPTEDVATAAAAPEDLEALVARAAASRPELAALRSRIAAAEATVRAVRSASLPQASLSAGYDYANPNSRILPLQPEWKGSWSAGVSVGITAFDGGRTSASVAQARAQADALRRQLEDLERRVRLDVTTRRLELETARAAVGVADRSLEAAQENVRVSQDRYREGVSPSSELLDAETAALRAGLERTRAATRVRVALASLDRAVGR